MEKLLGVRCTYFGDRCLVGIEWSGGEERDREGMGRNNVHCSSLVARRTTEAEQKYKRSEILAKKSEFITFSAAAEKMDGHSRSIEYNFLHLKLNTEMKRNYNGSFHRRHRCTRIVQSMVE